MKAQIKKEVIIMKKLILFFGYFSMCITTYGCPSCEGRITEKTPPFFSDEFYVTEKKNMKNMDYIYQELQGTTEDLTITTTASQAQKEQS